MIHGVVFVKKENENMLHLFWEYKIVQILLEPLDNWTLENGNSYIYTCRSLSKNLALTALIHIPRELYSTERIMSIKQENIDVFNNSWNCWYTLLQNRNLS